MSYVLINGKRYYKDERTGKTTLDNVSQAEADQRAQRNQGIEKSSERTRTSMVGGMGSNRTTANSFNTTSTNRAKVHTEFPWKVVIGCVVMAMFIGAFFYNRSHVSSEEQKIANYMNAQQVQRKSDAAGNESADMEENNKADADDVVTNISEKTAESYLDAADIENYNYNEIQLIINEIYARHGREFHTQENIDYFSAQDWYNPISGKTDEEIVAEFNEFERANVELLSQYL